ncbi:MAG: hypothetical protein IAF58_03760 [Leptolyngbya sp.]|nr:hypothetical protein [Candidatus Melainabacteria bacterium]
MNAKVLLAALSLSLLSMPIVPALADSETIVRTTTVTSGSPDNVYKLSASGDYVVVDPLSGAVKGAYDINRGYLSGTVSPGWVIMDRSSNRVTATFDSSGRIVGLTNVPAYDSYVTTIDTRRTDLERYIAEGLSLGRITADQAITLRSDLATISSQQSAYRLNGRSLTYEEALLLGSRLNDLNSKLLGYYPTVSLRPILGTTYLSSYSTSPTTSVVTTTGTAYVTPARTIITPTTMVVASDDLSARNAIMTQKIDDEYKAGRLTNRDVAKLKERLNDASTRQNKYTRNGSISESKRKYVSEMLDEIQSSMDRRVADTNRSRARIGIRVN